MKAFIKSLLIIFFITPVWASIEMVSGDTGRDGKQVFHIYKDIDLISTLKFTYGKQRVVIKSLYPQLDSAATELVFGFNQEVLDIVKDEISSFQNQVLENQDLYAQLPKSAQRNNLYIDYNAALVTSGKNHILSIRFSIQGFVAGMAHPYHRHRVLNYNLDTDEPLSLESLFLPNSNYLFAIQDYVRQILLRKFKNQEMVLQGTMATAGNYKIWNLKPNGFLFTFEEYQVAPYVFGAQTVFVPYSVLKTFISPDAPIIQCVEHKKCARDNLLTGGFINEASLKTRKKALHA